MVLLPSFLLILACLSGSFSKEDLQNKVFVFLEASNSSAVFLNAPIQQPFTKFTVCLRHYTLLTRGYAIFSYATKNSDNDILIYKPNSNQYALHVGGSVVTYTVPQKQRASDWEHICMTWDSDTGLLAFWLDGQPLPRMGIKRGYSISDGGTMVLGQDQDTVGGGFDINQSFVGEIAQVSFWLGNLTPLQMHLAFHGKILPGQLVSWNSLNYTTAGNVVVADSLFHSFSILQNVRI